MSKPKRTHDDTATSMSVLLCVVFLIHGLLALVLWIAEPDRTMYGVSGGISLLAAGAQASLVRRRRAARKRMPRTDRHTQASDA